MCWSLKNINSYNFYGILSDVEMIGNPDGNYSDEVKERL